MGNLDPKTRIKLKRLTVFVVFLAVILIAIALFLGKETRVVHLSDGRVVKLEDYSFRRGATSGNLDGAGTRLAVSDDQGQLFDPVVNYLGNSGVFEVEAFPRRGKEVRLRLMNGEILLAEFRVPNPCPGPHKRWTEQRVPVIASQAPHEITLAKFEADAIRRRTRFELRVRENERESIAWLPVSFEVSDATGNHWRPRIDSTLQGVNEGRVPVDFSARFGRERMHGSCV